MLNFGAPCLDELLDDEHMALLRKVATRRSYRDGDIIHDRGDIAPAMGIVVSGQVRMVSPRSNGRENLVAMVNPGQNYGDAVITGRPRRQHRAIAIGDTVIDHIDRAAFEPLLDHPKIMRALYIVAAHRLVLLIDLFDDLRALPPEVQLAKVLLMLHDNSSGRHSLDYVQEDIANLLGISTVTLAKALKVLRQEGLIETGYRRLTIVDPAKLHSWVSHADPF